MRRGKEPYFFSTRFPEYLRNHLTDTSLSIAPRDMKDPQCILRISEDFHQFQYIISSITHTTWRERHDIVYGRKRMFHYLCLCCTVSNYYFCMTEGFLSTHIACFDFCLYCSRAMRYLTDDFVEVRIYFLSDGIHTRDPKICHCFLHSSNNRCESFCPCMSLKFFWSVFESTLEIIEDSEEFEYSFIF